jgi:hypothetical protein
MSEIVMLDKEQIAAMPMRELARAVRAARTAYLHRHGVPISAEFANFVNLLGELIERCEAHERMAHQHPSAGREI